MLTLWNIIINLLWPLLLFYRPFMGTLRQRLGHFELGGYNPEAEGLRVLINAVSAGEVVAIAPFITELKRLRPGCQIVVLTTTESGQEMARDKLGDSIDLLAFFPLIDLPFVVRRYLNKLRPHVYITTESELWPNIATTCRRRGIPVALANARLYLHNKTCLRGYVVQRELELIDLIICQDRQHLENFRTFGLPEERLTLSGNTKFDFKLPEWDAAREAAWRREHGLGDDPVLVAGSTHEHEESLLLKALEQLEPGLPRPRLVLAPRHIERADEVAKLCNEHGLNTLKLADHAPGAAWDVLVIDRYGVLVDYYRLAEIVVMGGTFHAKVGGHNILEATVLGKPVIVGPYTFSITAQLELLKRVGGVMCVEGQSELASQVSKALANPELAHNVGLEARKATLANRGAARRAVDAVLALIG